MIVMGTPSDTEFGEIERSGKIDAGGKLADIFFTFLRVNKHAGIVKPIKDRSHQEYSVPVDVSAINDDLLPHKKLVGESNVRVGVNLDKEYISNMSHVWELAKQRSPPACRRINVQAAIYHTNCTEGACGSQSDDGGW